MVVGDLCCELVAWVQVSQLQLDRECKPVTCQLPSGQRRTTHRCLATGPTCVSPMLRCRPERVTASLTSASKPASFSFIAPLGCARWFRSPLPDGAAPTRLLLKCDERVGRSWKECPIPHSTLSAAACMRSLLALPQHTAVDVEPGGLKATVQTHDCLSNPAMCNSAPDALQLTTGLRSFWLES